MTGTVNESKQIAHSSSEPELRINFIFLINFFCSSSGVSFPREKGEKLISEQICNMTRQVNLPYTAERFALVVLVFFY